MREIIKQINSLKKPKKQKVKYWEFEEENVEMLLNIKIMSKILPKIARNAKFEQYILR